ncbi:MAG TPA: hypothetical protein DCR94_02485 [Firmicutes bacterium]|nr:hypothetical protein [Bacillota bacterium]
MAESSKKNIDYNYKLKKAFGLLLLLVSLLLLLSPGTHLFPLGYPFISLFGMIGHVWICLFLIFLGIYVLFLSPLFKIKPHFVIAFFLSLFFLCSLFSLIYNIEMCSYSSLSPFFTYLSSDSSSLKNSFDFSSGGGIVGYFFNGLFVESVGTWLGIVFCSILAILSICIAFIVPIEKQFKNLKAKSVIRKARKEKKIDNVDSFANDKEVFEFNDGSEDKTEPTSIFAPEEVDDSFFLKSEEKSNPLSSFVFEPAGNAPLPSRNQTHISNPSSLNDVGPKEVPNPNPSLYSQNSIGRSGLREAIFSPSSLPNEDNKGKEGPLKEEHIIIESVPSSNNISRIEDDQNPSSFSNSTLPFIKETSPKEDKEDIGLVKVETTPLPSLKEDNLEPTNEVEITITEKKEEENNSFKESESKVVPNPLMGKEENKIEDTPIITSSSFAKEEVVEVSPDPAKNNTIEENPNMPKAKPRPSYVFPTDSLLQTYPESTNKEEMDKECQENCEAINTVFANLNVGASVVSYTIGPSVTRYDVLCNDNFSVSGLGKVMTDVGIKLGGVPTRFVEMVPGKKTSAIEIANKNTRIVPFKEVLDGLPNGADKNLYIPFGVNIEGKVISADMSKFPHMLVAGTTGSGKSIYMHSVIMSLIMRNRPEDLKLVLVDPKRVELSKYRDLPHLLCPIIKQAGEAKVCLKKLCDEMDRRYTVFEEACVSGIREYNDEYASSKNLEKMPFIVVFVDEYADLVDAEKSISEYILRLAQKARAAGIHLFIATQRPDVKIITGTIKSNLPVRVALSMANAIDSGTILGQGGAEDLAGRGDMLVDCTLIAKKDFVRCQCPLVENKEIMAVADYIRGQQKVAYNDTFLDLTDTESPIENNGEGYVPSTAELKAASQEEKYQMIKSAVMAREYTSISQIQRDYGVGFPRAGKIFSRLQAEGIVAKNGDAPTTSRGCPVIKHSEEKPSSSSNPGSLSQSETTFYAG